MVRRWSYLNTLNFAINFFSKFEKSHKLIIFKSSVSLKRFNIKFTKFKRKAIARRKHRTNWLIYLNVFEKWTENYIFNKQLCKFQFNNKIFANNYFCYNFNYIRKRFLFSESLITNSMFLFTTLSKKIYLYFNQNIKFYSFRNFNITYLYLPTVLANLDTITTLKIYPEFDNLHFPNYQISNTFSLVNDVTLLDNVLMKIKAIYKILIILFYCLIINVN